MYIYSSNGSSSSKKLVSYFFSFLSPHSYSSFFPLQNSSISVLFVFYFHHNSNVYLMSKLLPHHTTAELLFLSTPLVNACFHSFRLNNICEYPRALPINTYYLFRSLMLVLLAFLHITTMLNFYF